jgi:hypothetical protein
VECLYPMDPRLLPSSRTLAEQRGGVCCEYCRKVFPTDAAERGHRRACRRRALGSASIDECGLFGRHGAVRLERSVEEVTRPVSTIRRPRGSSSESTGAGRGGSGGAAGDEPTSEYEKRRLANIERNKQMLISLGIVSSPLSPPLSLSGVAAGRAGAGTRVWPLRKGCRERAAGGSKRERGGGGRGDGGGGAGGDCVGVGGVRSRCATQTHTHNTQTHTHTAGRHTHTHTRTHTLIQVRRGQGHAHQKPRRPRPLVCKMCCL